MKEHMAFRIWWATVASITQVIVLVISPTYSFVLHKKYPMKLQEERCITTPSLKAIHRRNAEYSYNDLPMTKQDTSTRDSMNPFTWAMDCASGGVGRPTETNFNSSRNKPYSSNFASHQGETNYQESESNEPETMGQSDESYQGYHSEAPSSSRSLSNTRYTSISYRAKYKSNLVDEPGLWKTPNSIHAQIAGMPNRQTSLSSRRSVVGEEYEGVDETITRGQSTQVKENDQGSNQLDSRDTSRDDDMMDSYRQQHFKNQASPGKEDPFVKSRDPFYPPPPPPPYLDRSYYDNRLYPPPPPPMEEFEQVLPFPPPPPPFPYDDPFMQFNGPIPPPPPPMIDEVFGFGDIPPPPPPPIHDDSIDVKSERVKKVKKGDINKAKTTATIPPTNIAADAASTADTTLPPPPPPPPKRPAKSKKGPHNNPSVDQSWNKNSKSLSGSRLMSSTSSIKRYSGLKKEVTKLVDERGMWRRSKHDNIKLQELQIQQQKERANRASRQILNPVIEAYYQRLARGDEDLDYTDAVVEGEEVGDPSLMENYRQSDGSEYDEYNDEFATDTMDEDDRASNRSSRSDPYGNMNDPESSYNDEPYMYDIADKYRSIYPTDKESYDDFYDGDGANEESYDRPFNDDNIDSFDDGDRFERNEYRPTKPKFGNEDKNQAGSPFSSSQSQPSPFGSSTDTSFDDRSSSSSFKSDTETKKSSPFSTLTKDTEVEKRKLSPSPFESSSASNSFNNAGSSSSSITAPQSQTLPKSNPTSAGSSPFGSSTDTSFSNESSSSDPVSNNGFNSSPFPALTKKADEKKSTSSSSPFGSSAKTSFNAGSPSKTDNESKSSPFSNLTKNKDEKKPTLSSSPFGSSSGKGSFNNEGPSSTVEPLPKSTSMPMSSSPFGSSTGTSLGGGSSSPPSSKSDTASKSSPFPALTKNTNDEKSTLSSSPFGSSTGTSVDAGASTQSAAGSPPSPFSNLTKNTDEKKPAFSSSPFGSSGGSKSDTTSSSPFNTESSSSKSDTGTNSSPFSTTTKINDEKKPTSSSPFGSSPGNGISSSSIDAESSSDTGTKSSPFPDLTKNVRENKPTLPSSPFGSSSTKNPFNNGETSAPSPSSSSAPSPFGTSSGTSFSVSKSDAGTKSSPFPALSKSKDEDKSPPSPFGSTPGNNSPNNVGSPSSLSSKATSQSQSSPKSNSIETGPMSFSSSGSSLTGSTSTSDVSSKTQTSPFESASTSFNTGSSSSKSDDKSKSSPFSTLTKDTEEKKPSSSPFGSSTKSSSGAASTPFAKSSESKKEDKKPPFSSQPFGSSTTVGGTQRTGAASSPSNKEERISPASSSPFESSTGANKIAVGVSSKPEFKSSAGDNVSSPFTSFTKKQQESPLSSSSPPSTFGSSGSAANVASTSSASQSSPFGSFPGPKNIGNALSSESNSGTSVTEPPMNAKAMKKNELKKIPAPFENSSTTSVTKSVASTPFPSTDTSGPGGSPFGNQATPSFAASKSNTPVSAGMKSSVTQNRAPQAFSAGNSPNGIPPSFANRQGMPQAIPKPNTISSPMLSKESSDSGGSPFGNKQGNLPNGSNIGTSPFESNSVSSKSPSFESNELSNNLLTPRRVFLSTLSLSGIALIGSNVFGLRSLIAESFKEQLEKIASPLDSYSLPQMGSEELIKSGSNVLRPFKEEINKVTSGLQPLKDEIKKDIEPFREEINKATSEVRSSNESSSNLVSPGKPKPSEIPSISSEFVDASKADSSSSSSESSLEMNNVITNTSDPDLQKANTEPTNEPEDKDMNRMDSEPTSTVQMTATESKTETNRNDKKFAKTSDSSAPVEPTFDKAQEKDATITTTTNAIAPDESGSKQSLDMPVERTSTNIKTKQYYSDDNSYSLMIPEDWIILDSPDTKQRFFNIISQTKNNADNGAISETVLGPSDTSKDTNVSIIVSQAIPSFTLQGLFASPTAAADYLLTSSLAPAKSGRNLTLLNAQEGIIDGIISVQPVYKFEYILDRGDRDVKLHAISMIAVMKRVNESFAYTMTVVAPSDDWNKVEKGMMLEAIANSFKLLA